MLVALISYRFYDHYADESPDYAYYEESIALVKLDRDLRLADAMANDPPWLRRFTGVAEPAVAKARAVEVLKELARGQRITVEGFKALVTIRSREQAMKVPLAARMAAHPFAINFRSLAAEVASHRGTWWDAQIVESWENVGHQAISWRAVYTSELAQLRARIITLNAAFWLLVAVGLAFIPRMVVSLVSGLSNRPKGMGGAWSLSLGLVVFLLASLAGIGFSFGLSAGLDFLPMLSRGVALAAEAVAILLPAAIALGLLFKKPSHAVRVIGLARPIDWKLVLGMFTLLMIIDVMLRAVMAGADSNEPGGALDLSGVGYWGLFYSLVTACLLAPFAEEILFRGVLFSSFRNRVGVFVAAIISSVVFALFHLCGGYCLVSIGIFGFSIALLYAATESLATVIALHILYNLSVKVPDWLIYHAPLG